MYLSSRSPVSLLPSLYSVWVGRTPIEQGPLGKRLHMTVKIWRIGAREKEHSLKAYVLKGP